jgi:hypothetical protein
VQLTIVLLTTTPEVIYVKWFHYVACFFAGFFLIHLVPHLSHGYSLVNVIGATISLVVGCLLLWAGKASVKRPWTLIWVLLGMIAVVVYGAFFANHGHRRGRGPETWISGPTS